MISSRPDSTTMSWRLGAGCMPPSQLSGTLTRTHCVAPHGLRNAQRCCRWRIVDGVKRHPKVLEPALAIGRGIDTKLLHYAPISLHRMSPPNLSDIPGQTSRPSSVIYVVSFCFAVVRKSTLRILPDAVIGNSSTNMTCRGTLKLATLPLQ